jgi:hypothetical protein
MENLSIKDLKKTGSSELKPEPVKEIKKLSISEEFLLELNEKQSDIFNQLKSILTEQCDKYEFEAVTEDNLEDFAEIITYVENKVITLENDGVLVKLRKPLLGADGNVLTEKIKILYERNEAREKVFTKGIKVSKKSIESQKDFTLATLAASFDQVDNKMISIDVTKKIQKSNHRDYMLLLNCFNFFRN